MMVMCDGLVDLVEGRFGWNLGSDSRFVRAFYLLIYVSFLGLMVSFVLPTLDKSFTWLALLVTLMVLILPVDRRLSLLTFISGSALGYFLERWGTTRLCWTYYTLEQPPVFAVFAHGIAAVAFWRVKEWVRLGFSYVWGTAFQREKEMV